MTPEPTQADYIDHLETSLHGELEYLLSLINSKNWQDAVAQCTEVEEWLEKLVEADE